MKNIITVIKPCALVMALAAVFAVNIYPYNTVPPPNNAPPTDKDYVFSTSNHQVLQYSKGDPFYRNMNLDFRGFLVSLYIGCGY